MALVYESKYPGRVAAADSEYPQGKAQNISTPGDGTGTPWDFDLINDYWGFLQKLLLDGGVTPSGLADTVLASDYTDALDAKIADAIADAVPAASTTVSGLVELATSTETITGTDAVRAITPAGLTARTALDSRTGLVELATSAETITGTDAARAVTPAGLASRTALSTRTGLVELATNAETVTGTDAARAVTPAGLKNSDGAWQTPTLSNGWAQTAKPLRYRLIHSGRYLRIVGEITGTSASDPVAFTLTGGYVPSDDVFLPVFSFGTTDGPTSISNNGGAFSIRLQSNINNYPSSIVSINVTIEIVQPT